MGECLWVVFAEKDEDQSLAEEFVPYVVQEQNEDQ